jgi:hypothetical protein
LEKLLFAQCGPIRHTVIDAPVDEVRTVKIRRTTVNLPPNVGSQPPYTWRGRRWRKMQGGST